ncbi:MAG: aspartate/glutamate racemase family protein [Alphaproteobacteria bacterium]|nr:aspartate/glutamate racemase family protein [Alphaproteobacteria bacterium]
MKTLGLIGGMSAESTAIYYRLMNEDVRARLGGHHSAQLILWSVDFAPIEAMQRASAWEDAGRSLAEIARRLETAGAEAVVITANTMHKVADAVAGAIHVPLLHIADATAAAIKRTTCKRPLLLATRYTMEQDFYRGRLKAMHGIDALTPDDDGRRVVHDVIFGELVKGVVKPESKRRYLDVIAAARGQGADGIIFGCTEIGMLLTQADLREPVFDTALIHAKAAVDFALA